MQALIRGETVKSAAVLFGLSSSNASTILIRARQLMECKTMYQLIALEVVYLMEREEAELVEPEAVAVAVEQKAMGVAAGTGC